MSVEQIKILAGCTVDCNNCLILDPAHCAGLCNIYNPNTHHINITINISKKCNLNCAFCYNKNIDDKPEITIDILEKLFNYLEQYPSTSFSFYLLGGEPCLYPDLIEYIAEESLKRFKLLEIRIYSNGYCNIKQMNDLARKYKNIMFIISKNYKFRLYEELNLHTHDATLYINEFDTPEIIYQKTAYIKSLGYKYCTFNFDIVSMPSDVQRYIQNGVNILKYCKKLEDKNFHINNFNHNIDFFQKTLNLDFFGDEKFYFSHIENTKAIGDLSKIIDEETIKQYLFSFNQCDKCTLKTICDNYYINLTEKNKTISPYCLTSIINTSARDNLDLRKIYELLE